MLSSGKDAGKAKAKEKDQRKGGKKGEQARLGKRSHNRTSIFQNQGREQGATRHIDFMNSNNHLMFNPNGMIRKTEVTRMMSLLADQMPLAKRPQNFCKSIQRNPKDEDLVNEWVKQSEDKPDIRSFNAAWSGLNSLQNPNEEIQPFGPNSMLAFEKDASKPDSANLT